MDLDDNPMEIFDLILEKLEATNLKLNTLSARLEAVEKQIAKPAVANVDTVKLATEVNRNLSNYAAAGEKVAARIEAAVNRIPQAINNQYGLNKMTSRVVIVMLLLLVSTGLTVFFTLPSLDADRLKSRDQSIKWYRHEVDYMRSKNPKTAANYDAEFRRR